jgi:hypothetical protein
VAACGDAQAEQVEKERAACPSASLYFLRLFSFSKKKKKKNQYTHWIWSPEMQKQINK